jgi:cytoskeletal protein CcmA (bactofilin family)
MAQEKNMFGKKGRRPETIRTLVGENAHVQGDLGFEGGCHIDGVINGGVDGSGDADAFLSISEPGRVQGNVHVPRLALSGTVEGDVVVTERAELSATARVVGDVYYNLIEIAAGAEINGKLIHKAQAQQPAAKPVPKASDASASMALSGAAKSAS